MHGARHFSCFLIVTLATFSAARDASAQNGFAVEWIPVGPADWNVPSNWTGGFVPEASADEFAVIGNNRSAFVQGSPVSPGGVILGPEAGASGALEIRSGGTLSIVADVPTTGALAVGQNGAGLLTIRNGGALVAQSISSGGAGSEIDLSGNAQLTSHSSANLNALTDIHGQAAQVNVANNLSFGANSRLQIDVAGAAAPLIKAGTVVNLAGVLEVEFTGTPAPGSVWNLFDAGSVTGQFSQIVPAGGALSPGQRLSMRASPSGASMNGVYGQLVLEQLLMLEVNRDTGLMRIVNPAATSAVSLDGYSITTIHDSLNTGNSAWNSLADQGVSGWIEANAKPTQLNELDTNAATTVAGGGNLSLGSAWQPQFSALGENREDLVFRYSTPSGELVTGEVIYTGTRANDLALIVDPATGQSQLRNASSFTVGIEGYTILSSAGSLNPAGWTSLQDNPAAANWLEANPKTTALTELKTSGVEVLTSNKSYNLGQLFNPANSQDLVFQYYAEGETTPTLGRVLYQPIPSPTSGDFDSDGDVDGHDFLTWQRGGSPSPLSAADLAAWKASFAAAAQRPAATGAISRVPEPATVIFSAACIPWMLAVKRSAINRRRSA